MLKFKEYIDKNGIDEKTVLEMIDAHSKIRARMRKMYQRYKADLDGPTIFTRSATAYEEKFESGGNVLRIDDKVNNQLNNAFDADIVDTKIGYMFGHPISYDVDDTNEALRSELEAFLLSNNAEDNDSEYGKMAAICGYAARLAYIDKVGDERIKNIDPWEVVFLGDEIHEPDYSLRYFYRDEEIFAEFYDDIYIYFFKANQGGEFNLQDIQPHMFDFNPLFGVANNKELKGDAEKVLALIDGYDRTLSDASNEIEQYRLAYLILRGMGADEETLANLKKNGIFELLGENDDVRYLTKDINDTMIENHLNRLEENILRFAKSVNFTDESFGTQLSGVAMRFKLMALENKCITMERKFAASLRYQFKVLFSAWSKRKGFSPKDYLKIFFGFKRNLPANILDEAQSTAQLKGHISERTRLGLLSFVDDVEFEIEEMKKDAVLLGSQLEPLTDDLDEEDLPDDDKGNSGKTSKGTKPCTTCSGTGKVPSNITGNLIQCKTCKGTGVVG
ncbi:phage portal protein [Bacillus sp. ISL-45]|uniref:phage portal protein n=1 Tax=Bacillus sp. ISL-45 TaxID=2819128 RepID=UPI001BE95F2A|nr:phage portal protein [Bacillus sp. ISL-45]MBT2661936.1 phage portal protein [Bacillus sp. ISL-45]